MNKRLNFSDLAKFGVKGEKSSRDTEQHESHESDRCGDHGCPLRADIFVDGRGSCLFHRLARMAQKNPADVTERIRRHGQKIHTAERYALAPLKSVDQGILRGVQRVESGDEHLRYTWAPLVYPEWLPVRADEHHHQWVDRAREELKRLIVSEAQDSLYAVGLS